MKWRAETLRTFTAVHTWTGLVAGFALFVAFYAGAITVFHHDLPRWQASASAGGEVEDIGHAQRLLDTLLERHPDTRTHVGMMFPGEESPRAIAYWQDAAGTWLFATLDRPEGSPDAPDAGLAELVNALHYSLGLPVAGTWLMGVVSLLYALALVTGVVIHLPRLGPDLFALRPGRNLKRFWQDAHNVVGVLGLPMHLMFAITGALLCLIMVLLAALNPLVYRGELMDALPGAMDTAPIRAAAGVPAASPDLAALRALAIDEARAQGLEDFEPAYLKLAHGGDAAAILEITGASPGSLGPLGAVALDVASGKVLATQLPGRRSLNHATLQAAYALHFGEYGNALVPWLYFLLGIGGAFLFYSGNLLWIESRRRRRHPIQPRTTVFMARATVGVCIGLCVAVSAAFVAVQALEALAPARVEAGIRWICFGTWGLCALWAALRPPARAARELLWSCAAVTALIPVAHGVFADGWPWRTAGAGHWPAFWVDMVALLMAAGFAALARASARRARQGDPNSVWADPAATG